MMSICMAEEFFSLKVIHKKEKFFIKASTAGEVTLGRLILLPTYIRPTAAPVTHVFLLVIISE